MNLSINIDFGLWVFYTSPSSIVSDVSRKGIESLVGHEHLDSGSSPGMGVCCIVDIIAGCILFIFSRNL